MSNGPDASLEGSRGASRRIGGLDIADREDPMAVDAAIEPLDEQRRSVPVDRRAALARAIIAILRQAITDPGRVRIELDDRAPSFAGPADLRGAVAHVRVHGPDAVGRLIWPITPDNLAEGYLRGDLDIDGDVGTAIEIGRSLNPRAVGPNDVRRLLRFGLELRRGTPPASGRPLIRSARLTGRRHSPARDLAAVRFHYDVGEDFYRLWLDRRMAYSCAYFERSDDPAADLDAAQEAKLELICRKLDLKPGQRLLDIGCGWGSLILYAAERHGVMATGVTLSERQATEANRRAAEAGVADRVRAEVRDYRDLDGLGPFDAVASVGMFEHVGADHLRSYFEAAWNAVAPGGRFLNHGIATAEAHGRRGPDRRRNAQFVERYVFPDGELVPVEHAVSVARDEVGFEVLDVQLLRPHYALTLRAWVDRLERSWDAAVAAAGEEVARTWRLYMSGARIGFERGDLDVAQLLLARPLADGSPAPRPLRPWW
jgi:cyclopropane-fatty-acyl-phospholipid synthase